MFSLNNSSCLPNIRRVVHTIFLVSKVVKPFLLIFLDMLWSTWEEILRTSGLARGRFIHIFLLQSFVIKLGDLFLSGRIKRFKHRKIICSRILSWWRHVEQRTLMWLCEIRCKRRPSSSTLLDQLWLILWRLLFLVCNFLSMRITWYV